LAFLAAAEPKSNIKKRNNHPTAHKTALYRFFLFDFEGLSGDNIEQMGFELFRYF